jgi:Ca2+-binding EF-hand superfamily protein
VPTGERGHTQDSRAAQQQLLHFFDRDGSGTIDFHEFVLIVICLSVPEKDIEVVFDVMDLVRNLPYIKMTFLGFLWGSVHGRWQWRCEVS